MEQTIKGDGPQEIQGDEVVLKIVMNRKTLGVSVEGPIDHMDATDYMLGEAQRILLRRWMIRHPTPEQKPSKIQLPNNISIDPRKIRGDG